MSIDSIDHRNKFYLNLLTGGTAVSILRQTRGKEVTVLMAAMKREQAYTRMNFRCTVALRDVMQEAADRSGVSLSEQTRRTLEKAYDVPEHDVWLPPILQGIPPKRQE